MRLLHNIVQNIKQDIVWDCAEFVQETGQSAGRILKIYVCLDWISGEWQVVVV